MNQTETRIAELEAKTSRNVARATTNARTKAFGRLFESLLAALLKVYPEGVPESTVTYPKQFIDFNRHILRIDDCVVTDTLSVNDAEVLAALCLDDCAVAGITPEDFVAALARALRKF